MSTQDKDVECERHISRLWSCIIKEPVHDLSQAREGRPFYSGLFPQATGRDQAINQEQLHGFVVQVGALALGSGRGDKARERIKSAG
jgi:hypothetical protein